MGFRSKSIRGSCTPVITSVFFHASLSTAGWGFNHIFCSCFYQFLTVVTIKHGDIIQKSCLVDDLFVGWLHLVATLANPKVSSLPGSTVYHIGPKSVSHQSPSFLMMCPSLKTSPRSHHWQGRTPISRAWLGLYVLYTQVHSVALCHISQISHTSHFMIFYVCVFFVASNCS